MLKNLRPWWLRSLVEVALPVLAGLGCVAAVIGIAYLIAAFAQPFRASDPQQQLSIVQNLLSAGALAVIPLVLYFWFRQAIANSWLRKGKQLSDQRRYQDALATYERALARRPRFGRAWTNKGVVLGMLGRYDEALAACDRALTINPRDTLAWNNKADFLCHYLHRYDEALAVCDEALARGVSMAGIWDIKGNALHALGREAEAQDAYQRVMTFPADDFLSWAARGDAHASFGQYHEALAAYDEALMLRPHNTRLWRTKAEVLRALGREAEAEQVERWADEREQ